VVDREAEPDPVEMGLSERHLVRPLDPLAGSSRPCSTSRPSILIRYPSDLSWVLWALTIVVPSSQFPAITTTSSDGPGSAFAGTAKTMTAPIHSNNSRFKTSSPP
jgi:hypothetical protein